MGEEVLRTRRPLAENEAKHYKYEFYVLIRNNSKKNLKKETQTA